jgi:DNA-binding response OmpR family regulator
MSHLSGFVRLKKSNGLGHPHQRRRRIFVAEDDAEMRMLVAEALRREDYDVVEASDSTQLLLRLVRENTDADHDIVDLILTDVRMPGCSGLDVIEVLRDADWQTPIIVMTAFGDDETRARAESLGAVLLDKPFRLDALRIAVRASLR